MFNFILRIVNRSSKVSFDLFKIMIPILIGVKILQEFNLIDYIAKPLAPIMEIVGLPAQTGLVWATAMLNNIYSALIVFLSLQDSITLTTAQVTVLGTIILVAHSLPIELRIVQSSGPRLLFQFITRFGGAILIGYILNTIYSSFNLFTDPAHIILANTTSNADETLLIWALGELKNLFSIFLIITALLLTMEILEKIKIVAAMNFLLRPVLKLLGIGEKASTLTIAGLTMGISYGGGIIISETRSGKINRKDVFYSLTLMGLCHSLFEDTFLLMMIGGDFSGLFWGRLIFSMAVVAILVKLTNWLPDSFCDKYLWGKPSKLQTKGSHNESSCC